MHPQNSSVSQNQRKEAMELWSTTNDINSAGRNGDDVYGLRLSSMFTAVILERQGTVIYKVRAGTEIWSRRRLCHN